MNPAFALEAFLETLWPTRCACCDRPGNVICPACMAALEYLDYWNACPRCGASWGRLQCARCALGQEDPPLHATPCLSALRYEGRAATLIRTYKDQGERRLAPVLALIVARVLPPSWTVWAQALTFVTASKQARRRRGFDHMEHICLELAKITGIPCLKLLGEPRTQDQRALGRSGRLLNTVGRFSAVAWSKSLRVILIDDVMTTGATLFDAKRALEEQGHETRLASIARV